MSTLSRTQTAPARAGDAAGLPRVYQDGVIAGLIGAATLMVWFFMVDLLSGRPFYTPSVLGAALFRSTAGVPVGHHPDTEMLLTFAWVNALVFLILGGIASRLLGLAERNPDVGFGILLLFVCAYMLGTLLVALLVAQPILHALAWPAILIGNLLAAAAMTAWFWWKHPHLTVWP